MLIIDPSLRMPENDLIVWRADWLIEQSAICGIRRRVFIEEQQVPEALEWDGLDETAIHVLGRLHDGAPCGTARLLPSGQIGRMAVLPDCRHRGVGGRMITALLKAAVNTGMPRVFLHAQVQAIGFYQPFGFEPRGGEFLEAGICHRLMEWYPDTDSIKN